MSASFVIRGTVCHAPTPQAISYHEHSFLVCENGTTRGIFSEIPSRFRALPLVDYGDALILPAMVDLHTHAPQFAFRGMSMDLELMQWLEEYTFPEETKFSSAEYAEKAYSIFADALRRSATGRAAIFATRHRAATEILMKKLEETGLITYVGKVNMDREAAEELLEESAERSAYDTFGWILSLRERFSRTKPILTPRFIPCCTDRLMEELHEIQRAFQVPVQSHLSENRGEISFVRSLRPQDRFYAEGYERYGLLGDAEAEESCKSIMAHCVWSSDEEIRLMKKRGVFVAHCPVSNMNLSSGIAPVRKFLTQGLRVALGSDVAGGHTLSLFQAATAAVQVSKLYGSLVDESASPLTFAEAFYLATRGGGAFFGKVGSFEEGFHFDAIVISDHALHSARPLTTAQRLERAFYLGLDEKSLTAKYVAGVKIDLT